MACLAFYRYRSLRATARRWIETGAVIIGAGYALIYFVRAEFPGHENLIVIQRYHLFPCAGLAIVIGAGFADSLRQFELRPARGLGIPLALAACLVFINSPLNQQLLLFFSLQTEQRPVTQALDRLADSARALGLTRAEVIAALDPIEPRWAPPGANILLMLPETGGRAPTPIEPSARRRRLLEGLGAREREVLLACSNITDHVLTNNPKASNGARQSLEPAHALRLVPAGTPGHYLSEGWPAFFEYEIPEGSRTPTALELDGVAGTTVWELWWTEERFNWSADRLVVLRSVRSQQIPENWVVPLERVPGLIPRRLRSVRLVARDKAVVALDNLKLVR
jgi:hypothetical protein